MSDKFCRKNCKILLIAKSLQYSHILWIPEVRSNGRWFCKVILITLENHVIEQVFELSKAE